MDIVTYALCKKAISDAKINAYTYRGSVATKNDLPASGNKIGDIYNTLDTGTNYAWTGKEWNSLGGAAIPRFTEADKGCTLVVDDNGELKWEQGSAQDVFLTKAEYDALGNEKLTDGKHYFITDWSEGSFLPENEYSLEEKRIGTWIDNKTIYRKTIELTDPSVFQKDVAFKVCDLPSGYTMLIDSRGLVKTYEGSYSNNDILIYATNNAIMAKQNFTGYPQKMWITIEYIK